MLISYDTRYSSTTTVLFTLIRYVESQGRQRERGMAVVMATTTDPPIPPSFRKQECPMPNDDQAFQHIVGATSTSGSAATSLLLPNSTTTVAASAAGAATTAGIMPQSWYVDHPVPTRRGLDSSPALFLWESRTTNIDVMSVSNTTRPVAVSR